MLPNHIWLAPAPKNHKFSSHICRNGTVLSGNAWSIIVKKKKGILIKIMPVLMALTQEAAWIAGTDCSVGLLSDLAGQTQPGVDRRRTDQMKLNADFKRNFSQ